ncbi:MAG: maleylacetoacetate isomerase [Burkholderiaceae bacterium]|nr:maleylacetoacetate isomerase [Burkholderiaceae bacterium]
MKLHSYFRSSAACRVRIALALKELDYESVAVHLSKGGGEQFGAAFSALNPQQQVPVLEDGGAALSKSLAIIEYLDEAYPGLPLLPATAAERARVRSLALAIACDIHPLNNLRVLRYLAHSLKVTPEQKDAWYRHWIALGLAALEQRLAREGATGAFCHGGRPTLADCCLEPQVYNARRFGCDLAPYPTILRIDQACQALPAFQRAHPDRQADAAA